MRLSRLVLGCLLALGLAPGTLLRETPGPAVQTAPVRALPIAIEPVRLGPFVAEHAWHLVSDNDWHGGYSALTPTSRGMLLAASDAGRFLAIDIASRTPQLHDRGAGRDLPRGSGPRRKAYRDIESLTSDPASGTIWAGLEVSNRIERYDGDLRYLAGTSPAAMRGWSRNSGPEAFVRLADGRFLAIEEGSPPWHGDRHRAVLFSQDPIAADAPRRFTHKAPHGYRPVDLAPLDHGRALILYRKLVFDPLPGFATALGVIDVDRATVDGSLWARLLVEFEGRLPQDNYEGLAVTEHDGVRHVWLISDDNFMVLQRSLLLELRWEEREKAPE